MPHWGIERQYLANKNQTDLAHQLVDAGCDLVLGSHPHVLQTMEVYKGKMIAYSQGNFCFGANRNPKDKETMIYQQTFTFVDGVLQSGVNVHVIPPCHLILVPMIIALRKLREIKRRRLLTI